MAVMTQERRSRPARATPSTPGRAPRRGRILGLDGLRAVAVLAVLVFHVRPATLPGGYLGVDVFFVLSGFLITTLLVREIADRGRIDLRGFWTRRARRLLPALVLVVVVATAAGLAVGDDLLVDVRRQVLGALTFSNNWLEIGAGSSYFTATAPQLFVNFWSLAVEEQFYLVWPVLLALLLALTRTTRQRVVVVGGLALVSAALMALLADGGTTRVYYGTDTHAFGLMAGAALALGLAGAARGGGVRWQRLRVPVAVLAVAGLVALLLTLDGEHPFAYRGGILLASLLTVALVATLATAPDDGDLLVRALGARPLRWVGERSYGIYLWHWPVLLVAGAALPPAVPDSAGSWLVRGLAVVLTLAIAAASYRFLETPVRRDGVRATVARAVAALRGRAGRPDRRPRLAAALAAATVVAFGVALVVAPDTSAVEDQMAAAADAVDGEDPPAATNPDAKAVGAYPPREEPPVEEGAAPEVPPGSSISAFGDSMLYVAAPALKAELPGIAIDAESNRQWPAVVDAVSAALEAGTVRDVVVLVAGTNAGLRDPAPLEEVLELLGPERQVVVVNLYHSSSWIGESNDTMAAVAADHPNVEVADWYGTITQHLDQLQPDGVHPDMDGMYLFADVVTAALAEQPREIEPLGTR